MNKSLGEILHGGPVDRAEVIRVSEILIFERAWLGPQFLRFSCLLVQEWLDGSGYRLLSVDADTADGTVNLLLLGQGPLPPEETFEEQAREILFGRTIRLKVVESQTLYIDTQSP